MGQESLTPTGILIQAGFSEAECLALRDKVKAELIAGSVKVSEWSSHSTSSKRFFEFSNARLLAEIQYALEELDPETYGQKILPNYTRASF